MEFTLSAVERGWGDKLVFTADASDSIICKKAIRADMETPARKKRCQKRNLVLDGLIPKRLLMVKELNYGSYIWFPGRKDVRADVPRILNKV
jgi:hypothetical protein